MRKSSIAGVIFVLAGPAAAFEFAPENREIANAAYVLKHAAPFDSYQLYVYSPDRASFTGGIDSPVLVARTNKCTYAIKSKGFRGYKIDFSKLTGGYSTSCHDLGCQLTFFGAHGVGCVLDGDGLERCASSATIQRGDPAKQRELLSSIAFVRSQGCPIEGRIEGRPKF